MPNLHGIEPWEFVHVIAIGLNNFFHRPRINTGEPAHALKQMPFGGVGINAPTVTRAAKAPPTATSATFELRISQTGEGEFTVFPCVGRVRIRRALHFAKIFLIAAFASAAALISVHSAEHRKGERNRNWEGTEGHKVHSR